MLTLRRWSYFDIFEKMLQMSKKKKKKRKKEMQNALK